MSHRSLSVLCSGTLCGGSGGTSKSEPKTLCSTFRGAQKVEFCILMFPCRQLATKPSLFKENRGLSAPDFTHKLAVLLVPARCALEPSRALPKEGQPFQQHSHLLVTRGHCHSVSCQYCNIHIGWPTQCPDRSICYVLHQITVPSTLTLMGRHIRSSNRSRVQTMLSSAKYRIVGFMYKA